MEIASEGFDGVTRMTSVRRLSRSGLLAAAIAVASLFSFSSRADAVYEYEADLYSYYGYAYSYYAYYDEYY